MQKEKWDEYYRSVSDGAHAHDDWLGSYEPYLAAPGERTAVDLGCGEGYATAFLLERGFGVTSCDYSKEALRAVASRCPAARTLELDLRDALPFGPASFPLAVADLSIHYFDRKTTNFIIDEIDRILLPGGAFLCRVNSTDDFCHGAGEGVETEPHFYFRNGGCKRFFDRDDVLDFFAGKFSVEVLEYRSVDWKGSDKRLWEMALRKKA